ncbi:hypothetical protein ACFVVC_06060 [Pseudarthrobacter sp. NPDC058196]|uniref:hypothetical protein n=1 Tax=Pseudarthrobacter sp. NPDC058196 TaxID=3346376 RepID=UPI0036DC1F2D
MFHDLIDSAAAKAAGIRPAVSACGVLPAGVEKKLAPFCLRMSPEHAKHCVHSLKALHACCQRKRQACCAQTKIDKEYL